MFNGSGDLGEPGVDRQPQGGVIPVRSRADSFRVDARCRIIESNGKPAGRRATRFPEVLEVIDGQLKVRDAVRHQDWCRTIEQASSRQELQYFVLQTQPCFQVAAIIPSTNGSVVVKLADPTFADNRCLGAISRMLGLTTREAEVLDLLLEGEVPKTIAHRLGSSVATVRAQVSSLRSKCGLSSITGIVRMMASLPSIDEDA